VSIKSFLLCIITLSNDSIKSEIVILKNIGILGKTLTTQFGLSKIFESIVDELNGS
jgi:hypothetical protein